MGKIRAVAYHRIDYATIAQRVGQHGDRRKVSTRGPMTSVPHASVHLLLLPHSTRDPRHICATPGSKNGRTTMTTSDRSELRPFCLPSAITPTSTLITHSLLLLLIPSLLPHTATKSTQAERTKPRPAHRLGHLPPTTAATLCAAAVRVAVAVGLGRVSDAVAAASFSAPTTRVPGYYMHT